MLNCGIFNTFNNENRTTYKEVLTTDEISSIKIHKVLSGRFRKTITLYFGYSEFRYKKRRFGNKWDIDCRMAHYCKKDNINDAMFDGRVYSI